MLCGMSTFAFSYYFCIQKEHLYNSKKQLRKEAAHIIIERQS